ncbi:lantibiotic dehydratase [Streptomyces sp. URMC 127]|uniref:lantibiotic dehydratase n=1 Tax=Streptomyces sp. URMC 127 TaxID=3423402 RepID=UPI003F198A6C
MRSANETNGGYACADVVLLRAAIRPVDAAPDPAGTPSPRRAAADGLLREAVALASPSLSAVLDKAAAGAPLTAKEERRAERALARYALRMSERATPFGLMAGVATAGFARRPEFRWGERHTKSVRADMGWLTAVVSRLEEDQGVLAALRVTANDLCTVRGDRLVLGFVPVPAGVPLRRPVVREITVRRTAAVRRALELARTPVPWPELVRRMMQDFPAVAGETVQAMLTELVRRGVLLTELHPPMDDSDPLAHVLRLAARAGEGLSVRSRDVLRDLALVERELAGYATQAPGRGRAALALAEARMRRAHPAERLVQADLRLDVTARLPEAVRAEAERTAGVLATLAAARPGPRHLRAYHIRFLERYGTGRAVPVTELLDAERGLGVPEEYHAPASRFLPGAEGLDDRDRLLLAWAQEAAAAGERELVLDDARVARLTGAGRPSRDDRGAAEGTRFAPPSSFDLVAEVRAASLEAMAEGRFRLLVGAVSAVAGAVAGRFAPALGEEARRFGDVLRSVPARDPRAVRAQLTFRTLAGRAANVSRVPRWTDHVITVAAFADRASPYALGLDDLAVVATTDRLALVSAALAVEVVPTMPSMLSLRGNAPGVARFLAELPRSGESALPVWDWGAAAALPYLPRVRSGRSVLAPARWYPADPDLPAAVGDPATGPAEWRRLFTAWRERADVPDRVTAVHRDQRLTLDLTSDAHLELLRHEWRRRPTAHLQEAPWDEEYGSGWSAGHRTEIAFPMVRTAAPEVAREPLAIPPRRRAAAAHHPGSRWLYAKLYCSPERQDDILTTHLPGLLDESGTRWFYLRYADPDPHLRLRFHGEPADLGGRLLPHLGKWAARLAGQGLCGRLALDTYDPELERYGGPSAMAAAEAAFDADSRACLEQLALLRAGTLSLDARLLAAANYIDLHHRFLGRPDGALRLLGEAGAPGHDDAPTTLREPARRLLDADGRWQALEHHPGGAELLRIWDRRAAAVASYGQLLRDLPPAERWGGQERALASLLHMHHNRLAGTGRTAERQSLALARAALRAHLGRVKAGV